MEDMKCVMVIDTELPLGIAANTSAVLGVALGKHTPGLVGPDVTDATGQPHLGITSIPVTILRGDRESIKGLRTRLYAPEFGDLVVADFSDVAQSCHVYSEYAKAAAVSGEDYNYLGVAIHGSRKKINKLTGSMPLLR